MLTFAFHFCVSRGFAVISSGAMAQFEKVPLDALALTVSYLKVKDMLAWSEASRRTVRQSVAICWARGQSQCMRSSPSACVLVCLCNRGTS